MARADSTGVLDVRAGCYECHGGDAHWHGPNAMPVAARHHKATGHSTWVSQVIGAWWGEPPPVDSPLSAFSGDPSAEAGQ